MEPSAFDDAIRTIGRIPVERSTTYEHLRRKHVEAGSPAAATRAAASAND